LFEPPKHDDRLYEDPMVNVLFDDGNYRLILHKILAPSRSVVCEKKVPLFSGTFFWASNSWIFMTDVSHG